MIKASVIKVKMHKEGMKRAAQKVLSHKKVKDLAYKKAREVSRRSNDRLVEEFNNHPVTQEIEGGADGGNLSGAINSLNGNLFTFIGFSSGSSPADVVRKYITSKQRVYKTSKFVRTSTRRGMYSFRVDAPTIEEIKEITPLPWESGKSWVHGVERGISGIGHYMYKKGVSGSRSGAAIQIRGSLGGSFSRKPYMSALLAQYKINLRQGGTR